jgi:hypothetical protein
MEGASPPVRRSAHACRHPFFLADHPEGTPVRATTCEGPSPALVHLSGQLTEFIGRGLSLPAEIREVIERGARAISEGLDRLLRPQALRRGTGARTGWADVRTWRIAVGGLTPDQQQKFARKAKERFGARVELVFINQDSRRPRFGNVDYVLFSRFITHAQEDAAVARLDRDRVFTISKGGQTGLLNKIAELIG